MTANHSDHLFQPGHPRRLVPELSQQFHSNGWLLAAGGSFSMRQGNSIYVAPCSSQNDRLDPSDLFVLKASDGSVAQSPHPDKKLSLPQSVPVLMTLYKDRKAGAVVHSRAKDAVLASLIYSGKEFRIKDVEMIKSLYHPVYKRPYHSDEEIVIPIVENARYEAELRDSVCNAAKMYPNVSAVIVRKHGMFVWGDNWQQCKVMSECYHYLCEFAVELERLGLNEYTHGIEEQSTLAASSTSQEEVKVEVKVPEKVEAKPVPSTSTTPTPTPNTTDTKSKAPEKPKKTPATNNQTPKTAVNKVKSGRVSKKGGKQQQQQQQQHHQQQQGPPMGMIMRGVRSPMGAMMPPPPGMVPPGMMMMRPQMPPQMMMPPAGMRGGRGGGRGRGGRGGSMATRGGKGSGPKKSPSPAATRGGKSNRGKKRIANNVIMNY